MAAKILIADDHPITRLGVKSILESDSSFEIIGEATDGLDVINLIKTQIPDIIIMDVSMPNLSGIDATKRILAQHPEIKILALSIHAGENFVREMLNAGAVGYLLKEEAPEELVKALQKIIEGNIFLSSEVTRVALRQRETDKESVRCKILKTKLQRPVMLHEYLRRDRITQELEQNVGKPFSLVSAGAGYGKSVAVSQWLDKTSRLFVWISIDEEQNDLRVFLTYVVEAIEDLFPGYMKETRNAVSGINLPPSKDLFYIFFNELCNIDSDFILVLDDYHMVTDYKIHSLLDAWLSFPPPSIHLSIITRRDPPLKFKSLSTFGRMTEIRMDTLCFTTEEVVKLYKSHLKIDISEKSIETLNDKTEGWIIPIALVSMLIRNAEDVDEILAEIEKNMSSISNYLVSEVLSIQPYVIQNPMLLSSILDRFCAEILDEVCLNETDLSGNELIDFVNTSNLFIIGLDNENKWFRYHHLFQTLLHDQLLQKHSKNDIAKYHLKASQWFEKNNLLEEAMEHALIIKDYDWASKIVIKNRLTLLGDNDYYLLERLLLKLPTHIVDANPELLLVELHIQWDHDNFIALGKVEDKMKLVIDQLEEGSYVHNEFIFFVGYNALFLRGDVELALNNLEIAMMNIPESASGPRGMLEVIYMIFNQLGGFYSKVREMFYNLIKNNLVPIRTNRVYLGFIVSSLNQAKMDEVQANYLKALLYSRKSNMNNALGLTLYFSGSYLMRISFFKKAKTYFEEAIEIRYFVHSRASIDTMSGLIISNAMLSEKKSADEVMAVMEKYILSLGDYFKVFSWSAKIRLHMINNNRDRVKDMLLEYRAGVLDLVLWLDIPEITHARALVYLGSKENLKIAEKELSTLLQMTTLYNNRLHLLEVKVLQALLYHKLGEIDKAREALIGSLEISEPEGISFFYIELGDSFISLIEQMPDEIKNSPFIRNIKKKISEYSIKNRKKNTTKLKVRHNLLTPKELQVLECVSEGLNNQEIAKKLFNSEETIKKHIYHMFQKLYVKNRLSLVHKAREEGILK